MARRSRIAVPKLRLLLPLPLLLVLLCGVAAGIAAADGESPRAGAWADAPVVRPALPDREVSGARANPIDAFIERGHRERGLVAQPEAPKAVLLRRLYLDLIGVPPSPKALRAFLADDAPEAYERVVDRLLASPLHGERWGRHWMDIWRYSDWYGRRSENEIRYGQYHLWRWRDWIIESINADKGYDRMILEMLAGDELAPEDPDVLRATGFLGRNWYKFDRDVWFFQTVEETCAGFLALSMRCARCHEHKYDPLSQEEYFRFRAFFEPHAFRIDRVPGEPDPLKDGIARAYDAEPNRPTWLFARGDPRFPEKDRPLAPGTPAFLGGAPIEITPRALPLAAPSDAAGTEGESSAGAEPTYPRETTGRRLALARWIAHRDNPRTARVAVNHIWLRHFGEALVPTVDDFGAKGSLPSHPELLDWLAAELVDDGWSMKRIHRSIVTSSAYRRTSSSMGADGNVARDPRNAYLWRMNPRRLEAEVVRDAVLACAGRLDLALGGPELAEHLAERGGDSLHRRSIYFRVTPDNRAPMLAAFDLANPNACYRRQESIVPQQALVMMNSAPAMDCSRILARELTRDSPTAAGDRDASVEFVAAAFERVLSRSARAEESAACVHFLSEQTSRFASGNELSPFPGDETERLAPAAEPWLRARESLILVLFSHHEFITLR